MTCIVLTKNPNGQVMAITDDDGNIEQWGNRYDAMNRNRKPRQYWLCGKFGGRKWGIAGSGHYSTGLCWHCRMGADLSNRC